MHYVKYFDINGVATKQVGCIELRGKPNAATEGCVGVLGIDINSPTHDVYKCVAVNGSIYTWELLSSGMSIMSSVTSGKGEKTVQFPYSELRTPTNYVVKPGDLILDRGGYLYQITTLDATFCVASYCGTQFGGGGSGSVSIDETELNEMLDEVMPIGGYTVNVSWLENISYSYSGYIKPDNGEEIEFNPDTSPCTFNNVSSLTFRGVSCVYVKNADTGEMLYENYNYGTFTLPITSNMNLEFATEA
jgi:hypothetical protein